MQSVPPAQPAATTSPAPALGAPAGAQPPSPFSDPEALAALLAERPVILDGAMGTELDARGVDTRTALWSARALLDEPAAVSAVHRDYLGAGADVITTNTYQASVPAFEAAGLGAESGRAALRAGAALALAAASARVGSPAVPGAAGPHPVSDGAASLPPEGRLPLVAGSLGPFGAFLADGSEYTGAYDVDDPRLEAVHRSRIEVLAASGLRLFALETVPRLDEAQRVLRILRETAPDAACWVSFQVRDAGDRLADGTPLAEAAAWADSAEGVLAVGVNCVPPTTVLPALRVLATATSKPLVAYPNTGEAYDPVTKTWSEAPAGTDLADGAVSWVEAGARLLGGCCRTSPAGIWELAAALRA